MCVCAVCVLCGARFHSGVHKIVPECLGGSKLMQGTKNSPTEIPSVWSQLLTTDQGVHQCWLDMIQLKFCIRNHEKCCIRYQGFYQAENRAFQAQYQKISGGFARTPNII